MRAEATVHGILSVWLAVVLRRSPNPQRTPLRTLKCPLKESGRTCTNMVGSMVIVLLRETRDLAGANGSMEVLDEEGTGYVFKVGDK